MAKKTWQLNETHALIAAVRENPSLYDRRDPDYSRAKDVTKHLVSTFKSYYILISLLFFLRISGREYQWCQPSNTKMVSTSDILIECLQGRFLSRVDQENPTTSISNSQPFNIFTFIKLSNAN